MTIINAARKLVFFGLIAVFASQGHSPLNNFSAWHNAILSYPEKTQQMPATSPLTFETFSSLIQDHHTLMQAQLNNQANWVNYDMAPTASFKPFVQKLIVPAGSEIAMWGDLHGSAHSLLRSLRRLIKEGYLDENYKIIKPHFYMLFLGDYVDRGNYGAEVIATLLKLKLTNPQNVHLVRGNHEDASLNKWYGFGKELTTKFGDADFSAVYKLYDHMPVALFVGCGDSYINYVLCCHGGIEPGFNPHPLLNCPGILKFSWLGTLTRASWVEGLPSDMRAQVINKIPQRELNNFMPITPTKPTTLGFMWFDFIHDQGQATIDFSADRGWAFGRPLTDNYLQNSSGPSYRLWHIIRAHQHNMLWGNMLASLLENKGICKLWQGKVYTLLSAPASGFDFPYDSFVIMTTAHAMQDWHMRHCVMPLG